jgi:hypothetical protein
MTGIGNVSDGPVGNCGLAVCFLMKLLQVVALSSSAPNISAAISNPNKAAHN